MTQLLNGVVPLSRLGVIRVQGEDAASFLHGQLTQDFALLDSRHARLAAFCTAKGRMLASFIGFKRSEDEILLICDRSLLASTLKRLSMFVLRAKARLDDATQDFALLGLAGSAAAHAMGDGTRPWDRKNAGDGAAIELYPAAGQRRALWVGPANVDMPAFADQPPLDEASWQWLEVQSAVATLSAPVSDLFVPQMLNYESVGGVNFKKGCYPGQEIVARSQFRGTLKRRAYLAHAAGELQPAQEIHADDPEQPAGTVVQAAANPRGGWDAIVSLQTSAASQALTVAGGQALSLLPLPYPLLDDI